VGDIIQDSGNDPHFMISALSERRAYAIDSGGIRAPNGIAARLKNLAALKETEDPLRIELLMRTYSIKWYLINPDSPVKWREREMKPPAYSCNGYRLHRF